METRKENRGGRREGSGRKTAGKYGARNTPYSLRVSAETRRKIEELRQLRFMSIPAEFEDMIDELYSAWTPALEALKIKK